MTNPSQYGDAQSRTPATPYAEYARLKEAVFAARYEVDVNDFPGSKAIERANAAERALDAFVRAALEATHAPTEGER